MSNSSTTTVSDPNVILVAAIQSGIARYGLTMLLVFGNIGCLLNVIIFYKSSLRNNSCCFYLLSHALTSFAFINFGIIHTVAVLDRPNPSSNFLIYCKMRAYFMNMFSLISRTCIVLACLDRLWLCSNKVQIRQMCCIHIARRLMAINTLICFILPIHSPIVYTIDGNTRQCTILGSIEIIYNLVYLVIVNGLFIPFAMIICSLITFHKLKTSTLRVHVRATNIARIHKRDRQLMFMLLIQVITFLFSTFFYPINLLYIYLTQTIIKTRLQSTIEGLLTFIITSFLPYTFNTVSFYIYTLSGKTFQREIKKITGVILHRCFSDRYFNAWGLRARTTTMIRVKPSVNTVCPGL